MQMVKVVRRVADGRHSPATPAASEKCSSVHEVEPSPAGSERQEDRIRTRLTAAGSVFASRSLFTLSNCSTPREKDSLQYEL